MQQPATDSQQSLPKIEALPGKVHAQNVRCGKANCRCVNGSPHKAYYRFWREDGRVKKAYVRKADVERVRQACNAWAELDRAKATLLRSPEADKVRREIQQMLRSAGATEKMIRRFGRR